MAAPRPTLNKPLTVPNSLFRPSLLLVSGFRSALASPRWPLLLFLLYALCSSAWAEPLPGPMGSLLLHQSASNPRYFETATGRIVFLIGGYQGSEFQDHAFGGDSRSDFGLALTILARYDGNLLRFWTSETSIGNPARQTMQQMPWARSSSCCAADGGNRFDLARFDVGNLTEPDVNSPHYFERMRARVLAARVAGVYVSIMLWHSFGWENDRRIPGTRSWDWHPFKRDNNVNGIDGDVDGDGQGLELGSLGRAFTPFQEAYVRQVIETVGDLDNVLYEICNECADTPEANAWQQYFVEFVKRYERSKGRAHPVGMTSLQNFNNWVLEESGADFISPGGPTYEGAPPANRSGKVSILDMDHVAPCTGSNDRHWPWKALTRGHNLWYIYCSGYGAPDVTEAAVLTHMGQARAYAGRMDLRVAIPETDPSRCSTGYCLKGPDEVLAFLPAGRRLNMLLEGSGRWAVEWYEPTSGNQVVGSPVEAGSVSLHAPFSGVAVVFLVRNANSSSP